MAMVICESSILQNSFVFRRILFMTILFPVARILHQRLRGGVHRSDNRTALFLYIVVLGTAVNPLILNCSQTNTILYYIGMFSTHSIATTAKSMLSYLPAMFFFNMILYRLSGAHSRHARLAQLHLPAGIRVLTAKSAKG